MNLYFLDNHPKFCAEMLADVHLRFAVYNSLKFLSAALHRRGKTQVMTLEDFAKENQRIKYFIHDVEILVPTHLNHPITSWVMAGKENAYWMYELAYWAHKELGHRFNKTFVKETLLLLQSQNWVSKQLLSKFFDPQPHGLHSEFPLTHPPHKELPTDVILANMEAYKKLKDKVRLRWTIRPAPTFMSGVA